VLFIEDAMATLKSSYQSFPKSIQRVVDEIVKRVQPQSLILFGSRARGDHRENSDFDFAIHRRKCSDDEWNRLLIDLEEEPWSLYKIDLVELDKLGDEYKSAIAREGIVIYG
jgi:predicted nucleotidyltransferase